MTVRQNQELGANGLPCAFELDRQHLYPKFDELSSGCQFVETTNYRLKEHKGLTWCQFHLPPDAKENWSSKEQDNFIESLIQFANIAIQEAQAVDLCGTVFPPFPTISFSAILGENNSDLLLINSVLLCEISSIGKKFLGQIIFDGSQFHEDVDFSHSSFGKEILFRHVIFYSKVIFEQTTFRRDSSFFEAKFDGQAVFSNSEFRRSVCFIGATFADSVMFYGAKFAKRADFGQSSFLKTLDCDRVTFLGGADFEKTVFSGSANFEGTKFSKNAAFNGVIFLASANFNDAIFLGKAQFQCSQFREDVRFSASRREENSSGVVFSEVSFKRSLFAGRARFVNRRFLDTSDFREAIFTVAPEFYSCALHQDTDFDGAQFRDTKSTKEVNAAQAYRTLKLAMESVRSRDDQARFYALEQRSLRARKDTPRAVKVVSWLYETTTDYGRSFLRPVGWLIITFAVFATAYLLALARDGGTTIMLAEAEPVVRFTLRQVFRPFEAFSIRQTDPTVPLGLAIWGAVHSLLNFSLLALFLLAVRRRFKMD